MSKKSDYLQRAMDRALMAGAIASEFLMEVPSATHLELVHHVAAVQHLLQAALIPEYGETKEFKKTMKKLTYIGMNGVKV